MNNEKLRAGHPHPINNNFNSGLYIHIPYCKNKCPYCAFYSKKYYREEAEAYAEKLIDEMQKYSGSFDTVYFGGGTPSAVDAELIERLLTAAKERFEIADGAEITIECNPSSEGLEDKIAQYAAMGINRISLGMQSAVKAERLALGRTADKEQVLRIIETARRNGIENVSLDLMLGTPKQTAESLDETLDFIEQTGVPHISAYILSIEEGTPFERLQNKLPLPDEEQTAQLYLKAVGRLEAMGLKQYEVSNFAKEGFESRHNNKYWLLAPYLGLGATAHSFWNGRRFYYDEALNKTDDGEGGTKEEQIMLGLRLKKGIKKALIEKDLTPYIEAGLMEENGENISFTPKGFLVSNTVLAELI